MSALVDGLLVVLEDTGEPFDSWLYPGNTITFDDELGQHEARVRTRPTAGKVSIEVPSFLPKDIDAWVEATKHDASLSWLGHYQQAWIVDAREARVSPFLQSKAELDLKRWLYSQIEIRGGWGSHRAAMEAAATGGMLGRRDRTICRQILSGQGKKIVLAAPSILEAVLCGVGFDGDGAGGRLDRLAQWLASSNDWFETSCSGLWRKTAELFPWSAAQVGDGEDLGPERARGHIKSVLDGCGMAAAESPWSEGRWYSLSDLDNPDDEGSSAALEAFLYRWRDAEFDSARGSVPSRDDATTAGEGAIADEASPASTLELGNTFAEASLSELIEVLVPSVPQAAIDRLETVIQEAQQTPPEDKEAFVEDVNRVLDARQLRIRVEGKGLGKLTVRNGSIQISVAKLGSFGFRSARIALEPVSMGFRASAGPSPK